MRILSRSLLLATATILCMTINASPIQGISLASPNSTTNTTILTDAGVFCSPARTAQADIVACLLLLVKLPEGTISGVFHNAGPRDGYQLPVSLSYDACQVDVTVPEGRQDLSNWPAVRFAASQIIAACSVGNYPYGTTGGFARIGRSGDIRVTVGGIAVGAPSA